MKNSEAIKILKTALLYLDDKRKILRIAPEDDLYRYREAVNLAAKALGATVKLENKWKNVSDKTSLVFHEGCPNSECADVTVFSDQFKYCPNCGKEMITEVDEKVGWK